VNPEDVTRQWREGVASGRRSYDNKARMAKDAIVRMNNQPGMLAQVAKSVADKGITSRR